MNERYIIGTFHEDKAAQSWLNSNATQGYSLVSMASTVDESHVYTIIIMEKK